ncbi:MAG: polysaccharide biosynthesis C-terminal domain-containing protein [Clostridiales bacterium]|jgi:putative MATE family efflux protein|nr:polysaccharide biosynthesis C-terminal domain-containing protein [Clostridiales bacterium]
MGMTPQERADRLGTEKIGRLFASMAAPAICASITASAYNIIDRVFVGNFAGRDALGAIALIFPLVNISTALSLFLTVGGAARLSLALGRKDAAQAGRVLSSCVAQAVISGLVLTAAYGALAPSLVRLCGAGEASALHPLAVGYLRVTALGQTFNMCNLALAAMIRAQGNTRYSLFVSAIGSVSSITLDSVLVGALGFGIRGAACATVASQFVACACSAAYYLRGKSAVKWGGLRLASLREMGATISMGMAPSVFQGLSFISNMLINNSLMRYGGGQGSPDGALAISAVAVTATAESLLVSVTMGVNQAISPMISYNYGRGSYARARASALAGQAAALCVSAAVWAAMMLAPQALFSLFSGGDPALMAFGAGAMRKSKAFVFVLGFQTLASMYFSAIGRPLSATFISLSRQGFFLIPGLIALPLALGMDGVFYAGSLSDLCSALVVGFVYRREMRRLAALAALGGGDGGGGGDGEANFILD